MTLYDGNVMETDKYKIRKIFELNLQYLVEIYVRTYQKYYIMTNRKLDHYALLSYASDTLTFLIMVDDVTLYNLQNVHSMQAKVLITITSCYLKMDIFQTKVNTICRCHKLCKSGQAE